EELGRDEDEIQHEVTLTKGYWLGKYEVTQEQYEAVMGTNPSYSVGKLRPVEQVSRNEAMEFCEKLTVIEKAAGRLPEGYEYSLPTEAQWEYACRAGTTTALNSGKNLSDMYVCPEMDEVGWYDDNSHGWTSRVGWRKLPNAWGFYDMHGNVFEWCLDWYNSDYYENSPESDPVDLRESNICVRRGGSYARYSAICRSADRAAFGSGGGKDKETGFRVALVSKDMSVPLSKDVDLRMIWVEPGTFLMGSPEGELGGYTFEVQHEVTLTRGYWLGKYEVTQEQYEAVMGYNPSYFRGDDRKNHPVEYVTWEEAIEFCAKLTAIERETGRLPQGYVYSLPTSAQWEYACRAGTTTALNSGKNLSDKDKCPEMDEVGWYRYNSGEYDADGKDTDNGRHYPVGQKLPNAWGFYDMHGNVEEWCVDKSGEKYTNTAVTDPVTLVGTSSVVIRGGDYRYSTARDCRSAYRTGIDSTYGGAHIGFRVALVREMVIPISNYTDLSMVWIEPGTFIMGSPIEELGRLNREHQHEETLTQGYWMGRYEITQAQYHAVMGTNPSYFTDGQMVEKRMLPVEQVRWVDATNFCAKLTAIEREAGRLPEGYEYTLPTEVQWEYACRAGTTTAFNNGTTIPTVSQVKEEL
ncbi:MAG: formylglycine-generating enzyme family protein, partial [Verrucomicrobia bacterium]|nr:formylglycine-generating enzyme family protein [Verrucomicrobiota bacterium]